MLLLSACSAPQVCDTEEVALAFEIAVPVDYFRERVEDTSNLSADTCRALCGGAREHTDCEVLSDLPDSGQSDTGEEAATYVLVACTEWQETPCN